MAVEAGISPAAGRVLVRTLGMTAVGLHPDTGAKLYDSAQVRAALAARPGLLKRVTLDVLGRPDDAEQLREAELLREALHQAVALQLPRRRPQVARTMGAVVNVFAHVLATTGRISLRGLAEGAEVAVSTVEMRRAELLDADVLRRGATYRDDGEICDLYALGPTARRIHGELCAQPCVQGGDQHVHDG